MDRYDLLVIGGGPAGLTAAGCASSAGLRTLLVEKKSCLTTINRTCSQAFFTPGCGLGDRYYTGPVELEGKDGAYRMVFPDLDFSVTYNGPLKPSVQYVQMSPSGYRVDRFPPGSPPWGRIFNKEAMLRSLLEWTASAGATIRESVLATNVENAPASAQVRLRGAGGEETVEASRVIAADGVGSRVADSLGLNASRKTVSRAFGIAYILDDVTPEFADHESCLYSFSIPSVTRGTLSLGIHPETGRHLRMLLITGTTEERFKEFMGSRRYGPWFRQARLVKRTAYTAMTRTSIPAPAAGRVLVIGDAAAHLETLVAGAIACGRQAAVAVIEELAGWPGYEGYVSWWQRSFRFNQADYFSRYARGPTLAARCSDEEVDFLFQHLAGRTGDVAALVARDLESLTGSRPALREKLTR